MTNSISLVDAAITEASTKKGALAAATALVEARNEPHFCNRIGGAWAALVQERNQLRVLDLEDNGTRVRDMPIKPEMFLSVCQYIMNQTCWLARRYIKAMQQSIDDETARGVTGIDYSQDVAQDLGIEPVDISGIRDSVHADFAAMYRLHAVLSKHMSYLNDIEDLHVYVDRQIEGETWTIRATADTLDDALELLDEVIERMNERQKAELSKEMLGTDFTCDFNLAA